MLIRYSRVLLAALFLAATPATLAVNVEKLAKDDWLLVKSANFSITTDLDEETGKKLVEDLEAYRYFFTQMMNIKVIEGLKPLKMLAVANTSNFAKLDMPSNWAGVFTQSAFGYAAIANVDNYRTSLKSQTFARQVLFHEYNHFMVRFTHETAVLPKWYDEGMAEYWGSFKYDGEKIYLGDPSAIEGRINDLVNQGGSIILDTEKLLNTTELPLNSDRITDRAAIGRFYAQSFFLVHYLNSSPELRKQLENYLAYLNNGYLEKQAFQQAFGITYAELDKNAKAYLKKSLMMRVLGSSSGGLKFPPPQVSLTKLDKAGFYREMSDIMTLFSAMERPQLEQFLEQNMALNPDSPEAKAKVLLHNATREPQKLEAELEKQAPQHPLLLTYKGDNLRRGADMMRRAGLPGWEDQMKKARSLYRRAIKADVQLALAYAGLGEIYRYLPDSEPLKEGLIGSETAALYERKQSYFTDVADMSIRMNRGLDALPAMRNLIAFSRDKENSRYALVLDNLEILREASSAAGEVSPTGLRYASGSEYTGPVANGKPQGQGKFTRSNGSYYEGMFVDGVMQGQGKLVRAIGYQYSGDFQQGIARGKGVVTYPEAATIYTGDVNYTIPMGKGVATSAKATMEADYWFGLPHGKGSSISTDGTIKREGRWVYGAYEWPEENGSTFVGFIDGEGRRGGSGICVTKATSAVESCSYKDGVREQNDMKEALKAALKDKVAKE